MPSVVYLRCPACGKTGPHDTPDDRVFVSAYHLCDEAGDVRARSTGGHEGVRMTEIPTPSQQAVGELVGARS